MMAKLGKVKGMGGEIDVLARDPQWRVDLVLVVHPCWGSDEMKWWLLGGSRFLIEGCLQKWNRQAAVVAWRFGSTVEVPAIHGYNEAVVEGQTSFVHGVRVWIDVEKWLLAWRWRCFWPQVLGSGGPTRSGKDQKALMLHEIAVWSRWVETGGDAVEVMAVVLALIPDLCLLVLYFGILWIVLGSVFRSQVSLSSFEFEVLPEIRVEIWIWKIGPFFKGPNFLVIFCLGIDYRPMLSLTFMVTSNARLGYLKSTPNQLCHLLVMLTQFTFQFYLHSDLLVELPLLSRVRLTLIRLLIYLLVIVVGDYRVDVRLVGNVFAAFY